MPLKRRFKKRKPAKKPYKKRRMVRTSNSRKITRWTGHNPIPDIYRCKLRYVRTFTISAGTNIYSETVFRANSPYDPEYSSGPTQVTAYDYAVMSTLYNYYRVYASSMQAKFNADGTLTTSNRIGRAVIYASNASAGVSSITDAKAQRIQVAKDIITYAAGKQATLYKKASIARILGVKPMVVSIDTDYQAGVDSNPLKSAYWIVGYLNDGDSPADISMEITMDFWVEFFLPRLSYCTAFPSGNGSVGETGPIGVTGQFGIGLDGRAVGGVGASTGPIGAPGA